MRNLPKYETIADINDILTNLKEAIGMMKYIGKYSPDIYQSRIDQFVTSTEKTIRSLKEIKESIQTI